MHSFKEFLENQEYSQEQDVLSQLPNINFIQQVELDIALHNDAISKNTFGNYQSGELARDSQWKYNLIDIFKSKLKNPILIRKIMLIIQRDIQTHKRSSHPITGSKIWHQTWINVYEQWLKELHAILGDING